MVSDVAFLSRALDHMLKNERIYFLRQKDPPTKCGLQCFSSCLRKAEISRTEELIKAKIT